VPPQPRRSAGDAVLARAARFSNELLDQENACFAAIAASFATHGRAAVGLIRAAWKRAGDASTLSTDTLLRSNLSAGTAKAVAQARPLVAVLAVTAQAMALNAVRDELQICEASADDKYAGLADAAVNTAETRVTWIASGVVASFTAAEKKIVDGTDLEVGRQLTIAAEHDDGLDRVVARLCSPTPLTLPGNGGLGVLMRPVPGLQAGARAVSIRVANTVRDAAMEQFNVLAARTSSGNRARLLR
jgi:hypothetical protein